MGDLKWFHLLIAALVGALVTSAAVLVGAALAPKVGIAPLVVGATIIGAITGYLSTKCQSYERR